MVPPSPANRKIAAAEALAAAGEPAARGGWAIGDPRPLSRSRPPRGASPGRAARMAGMGADNPDDPGGWTVLTAGQRV
nr:hypothetical protein GCM10020093_106890 [Planobispora longispora]